MWLHLPTCCGSETCDNMPSPLSVDFLFANVKNLQGGAVPNLDQNLRGAVVLAVYLH
jgi:hypothetical protein